MDQQQAGRSARPIPEGGMSGRADRTTMTLGENLEAAAETVRERLPQEGRLGAAAGTLADSLERSGTYLQEQGLTGIIEDLEAVIRRYPVQSLLLGLGAGYLLSRIRMR